MNVFFPPDKRLAMSEEAFVPAGLFTQVEHAQQAKELLELRGVPVQIGDYETTTVEFLQWNDSGGIILMVPGQYMEKCSDWLEHYFGKNVRLLGGGVDEAELERQAMAAEAEPEPELEEEEETEDEDE
jgi:hypothetical protein